MAAWSALLLAYLLGGVTLLPLVVIVVAAHAYFFLPHRPSASVSSDPRSDSSTTAKEGSLKDAGDDTDTIDAAKLAQEPAEPDVAAAYFAVCREYVPGGVNGKPPERTTPAGQTITAESPSVYQSMYRSIFERGKSQSPTIEAGRPVKKARNVFFVVLRHKHLILFDNSEQLEVRHVISLEHHQVDVYAGEGNDQIPEGELWIKRNCIRLRKRDAEPASPPFFLFSDNCSEKEDFYHAVIASQELQRPLAVPTDDMIKLIRQLHASDESVQTRWLNAMLGRIFLALNRTAAVETAIRNKIKKKISRVAKPAFISDLRLESIDMGDSGPFFSNPKLREMTVDGSLTVEADVRYTGNFKAVIAAVARIDLGSRFKAREVNIVLAGVLKKLEGHLLVKIKPPPSNRLWLTFENVPRLDISLEPIVSSRQITYSLILRAIQSRIREVFAETLVHPNWDDMPFMHTEDNPIRGGIWKSDGAGRPPPPEVSPFDDPPTTPQVEPDDIAAPQDDSFFAGEAERPNDEDSEVLSSSPTPTPGLHLDTRETKASLSAPGKPKAMRSNSFASVANPVVSKGPAMTESSVRRQARKGQRDATTAMRTLSSKQSPESSPVMMPAKSDSSSAETPMSGSPSDRGAATPSFVSHGRSASSEIGSSISESFGLRSRGGSMTDQAASLRGANGERAKAFNQSLSTATAAAKNWGWGMLTRPGERTTSERPALNEPMGRGQPLPPPGVPLPRPDKGNWSVASFTSLRRKPVGQGATFSSSPGIGGPVDAKGERSTRARAASEETASDGMLTIAAPQDSEPTTPTGGPQTDSDEALPNFELGTADAGERSAAGQPDVQYTPTHNENDTQEQQEIGTSGAPFELHGGGKASLQRHTRGSISQ